jgi:hypothetical protein
MQESLDIQFAELTQTFDDSLSLSHRGTDQTHMKQVEGRRSASSNPEDRSLQFNPNNQSLLSASVLSSINNETASMQSIDSLAVRNVCQSLDREVESNTTRPNIINSSKSIVFIVSPSTTHPNIINLSKLIVFIVSPSTTHPNIINSSKSIVFQKSSTAVSRLYSLCHQTQLIQTSSTAVSRLYSLCHQTQLS